MFSFIPETNKSSMLAPNLNKCLAKTYKTSEGIVAPGRCVLSHCQIVGEVARELINRMPEWLVSELFPEGSHLVAATHDNGKVTPTFVKKLYVAIFGVLWNSIPGFENVKPELESQWGGHAGVSQITARHLKLGKYIPEILGQHHGFLPPETKLATAEVFGGQSWLDLRMELIAKLKEALKSDFPSITSETQARAIAGLTTTADWIGSGALFEDPSMDWMPLIKKAVDAAGFVRPQLKPDLSFFDVFGFEPRDTQAMLIGQITRPGVYILEAPMGLGKTEAALYAAYQMIAANHATGIYFALPTQLTSDKIHDRVSKFLEKILKSDSSNKHPLLLHGNAWLKSVELGKEGDPCGSWFQSSKRGILAPFAVGTIDQALMAVMNVQHGFVRAFGLAGKVVILDEVHSYDSYTGVIIDDLINALRDMHCTVIILSATLTHERRAALIGAPVLKNDYPLISALPRNGVLSEQSVQKMHDVKVDVQHCHDIELALDEVLLRAEKGQQVLWIENTVANAQEVYQILSARSDSIGVECGLLHSRFLKIDREHNENYWVNLYGNSDNALANRDRRGRILVGTQVLEQSLDIDADFLVSRFAPSDMLLQRIGRLWRHHELWYGCDGLRPNDAKREIWLLSANVDEAITNPDLIFGSTAKVYDHYVLCRSLQVWNDLQAISVPSQIRNIIEDTYSERHESGDMLAHLNLLRRKCASLKTQALQSLSISRNTLSEEKASTRYNDRLSVDVLLIKSVDKYDGYACVRFLDDTSVSIPANKKQLHPKQQRDIAVKLLQNTVRVADYLAPKKLNATELHWLQDYMYIGRGDAQLRVAKVTDSDLVVGLDDSKSSDNYFIQYNQYTGYQASK